MAPVEAPGDDRGAPPARDVRRVLADVDAVGGFFAIATDPAEAVDPAWRPVRALTAPDGPLPARVEQVAAQLGGVGRRVAASLLSISVGARPTSVLLGAAVLHGVLPDLGPDRLHWRPWSGGALPLWAPEPTGRSLGAPDDPATSDVLARELADVHLRPLLDALRGIGRVPPRVLWGNAASSLAGALRVLALSRPVAAPAAAALVRGVLAAPPFAGLGELVPRPEHPTGLAFARRSCCLYYRVPGGGTCEDCVLAVSRSGAS